MPVTDDGVSYEDGQLELPDGRTLAWRWWGEPGWTPILRLQGTPGSRLYRHPNPAIQRDLGVRYLMADRPGYGGSTRKPGRGIAEIGDDLATLLDHHGLRRVPVMGTSGGGPHALAIAARHPERVTAVSVIVGASKLAPDEVGRLVGVNAAAYEAGESGWAALHQLLDKVRERILGEEGMSGVLSDAPPEDRAIMEDPAWRRIARANNAEALRQGAEGWTDESMALLGEWDFDPKAVRATVTWWHGDNDMNAPLSAARRAAARLDAVDLRVWHHEGHLASLTHEAEIVRELLSRSAQDQSLQDARRR
jgi:pimeloyl-ACP methyl ester carboxylesterase